MITRKLIENRINNFWGYGNLDSKIWFIGMEEGFSGCPVELENRLKKTVNRTVIDIQDDMKDIIDHMRRFREPYPIQPTWGKLIFILLKLDNKSAGNDQIRDYQKRNLGRLKGNHCILEFMPLPCRSTRNAHWLYDNYGIEYLASRRAYLKKVMPDRINLFRKIIREHKPKIVVCYSLTYLSKWKKIIGVDVQKMGDVYFVKNDRTSFFIIPHPVARGKTNKDWEKIAETIKKVL